MTSSNERPDFLDDKATPRHIDVESLSGVLLAIKEIDEEIGTTNAHLANLKKKRDGLERLAVEEIETQRIDGVRVGGRSWRVQEELRLSVPKDRRQAVLDAAGELGISDEITTVATSTLKSWLQERAKEAGREAGQPFAAGTPFEGLVSEFVESKLRHVTTG